MRLSAPIIVVASILTLGGCLGTEPAADGSNLPHDPRSIPFPVELDHDHRRPELHNVALGFEHVARVGSGFGGLPEKPISRTVVGGDVLFAMMGSIAQAVTDPVDNLLPHHEALVVDIAKPDAPKTAARLSFPGGGIRPIAITADGKTGFVGTEWSGAQGIWTIDLDPPTDARIVGFTPMADGPHALDYAEFDGHRLVMASITHPGGAGAAWNNIHLQIRAFDPARPQEPMRLVSTYRADDNEGVPNGFPGLGEAVFRKHPVTQQPLLFVAHYERGVRILDITDPAKPNEIGRFVDPKPVEYLWITAATPAYGLLGGRHFTIVTPSCPYVKPPCIVRLLDTTDPTSPTQAAVWTLPGDATTAQGDIHRAGVGRFDEQGRLYMGFQHGGMWAFDVLGPDGAVDPTPVGYFLATGAARHSVGDPVTPLVGSTLPHRDHVFIQDRGSGIHVLREIGG